MPQEDPTGPKRCEVVCTHPKIDLTIPSPSYNVPAQSLAKRSVVQDSDYHISDNVIVTAICAVQKKLTHYVQGRNKHTAQNASTVHDGS